MALKIHGPNFGVGGGPDSESEVLRAASALLADAHLPGLWVILTAWDPEPIPDLDGRNTRVSFCRAVALALTAPRPDWQGSRIRLLPRETTPLAGHNGNGNHLSPPGLRLHLLQDALTRPTPVKHLWRLDGGGWMELACQGTGVTQS
jgi:hypothetical protein